MAKFIPLRKTKKPLSACCYLNKDGTAYSCVNSVTKYYCESHGGIWAGLSGDKPIWCSSTPCPTPPRTKNSPQLKNDSAKMTPTLQTKLDKLKVGDEFEGGTFMGYFEPGPEINGKGTEVRGNEFTGYAQEYDARGFGPGVKRNRKWAIIIDEVDSTFSSVPSLGNSKTFSDFKVVSTSFYDGHYNTYGDGKLFYGLPSTAIENIKKYTRNGYNDWYIPSIDELAFLNSTLHKGVTISNTYFNEMNGTYFTSSLFSHRDITRPEEKLIRKQDIRNDKYLYCQEFNTKNDGFVKINSTSKLTSSETKVKFRLVRRIIV